MIKYTLCFLLNRFTCSEMFDKKRNFDKTHLTVLWYEDKDPFPFPYDVLDDSER